MNTSVNLPIHEHPLFRFVRSVFAQCKGCLAPCLHNGGYVCNDCTCIARFHKDCAEAPSEKVNHPSHLQHPLVMGDYKGDGPCDLCGQKLLGAYYSCSTCKFKVDLLCGIKPPQPAIEHPMCHDHSLVFLKKQEDTVPCEVCKVSFVGPSYSCLECNVYFHVDCIHLSEEVNHPCHVSHPLKLIAYESLPDDAEKRCFFCRAKNENVLYHCSICNFTTCLSCTKNPPPLVINHTKTHKHPLTLFSRRISCFCNVCGERYMTPYMCLQCDFSVHGGCIDIPRVININRHDHRIYLTPHIGHGYLQCGVCRKSLSQYYGAYACPDCPSYAVHTRCATRHDVWDGVELEGIPKDTEDITPFKVVGDNLIIHFSHEEHTLRLQKDTTIHDESERCEACTYQIGFDPIYSCEECCYVLHEKCANLPMKKRLVFGITPYILREGVCAVRQVLDCELCGIFFNGFIYTPQRGGQIDVHCGSLSEPFLHEGHIHPLYFDKKKDHTCDGCNKELDGYVLRCDACDFDLCLSCASFPKKVKHSNDEHPLILCCGGNASEKHWCDICEGKLDPSKWFYACYDCGATLHANCVIGDFSRLMPGCIIEYNGHQFEVVLNSHNTRPFCKTCHFRCKVSVILKDLEDNKYICSRLCFFK